MTRNQYLICEIEGRINSGTYNSINFIPTPEEMQALKEWADPKERKKKEREGNIIMEKIGGCPHH